MSTSDFRDSAAVLERITEMLGAAGFTIPVNDLDDYSAECDALDQCALVPFTSEETLYLLEAAREALNDAGIYDTIVERMDVSDEFMFPLREKLQAYMSDEKKRARDPWDGLREIGIDPTKPFTFEAQGVARKPDKKQVAARKPRKRKMKPDIEPDTHRRNPIFCIKCGGQCYFDDDGNRVVANQNNLPKRKRGKRG